MRSSVLTRYSLRVVLSGTVLIGAALAQQLKPLWKAPFEILPVPSDASSIAAKMGDGTGGIWADGDILTIAHKHAGDGVRVSGGIQEAMKRIPGSDYHVLQLKMSQGWEEAVISYMFLTKDFQPGQRIQSVVWRGPKAPTRLPDATELKGQIIKRSMPSKSMGKNRDLTIYLPPNAPKNNIPAFFMADGNAAEAWGKAIEPYILAGKMRPVAVVGIASGEYEGDRTQPYDPMKDFRAREYVPGHAPEDFKKHMEMFTREVPVYVAKEFGISRRWEDRAVVGFSNGGSFAAAAGAMHPSVFGHVLPFSVGVPHSAPRPSGKLPKFHFVAGKLESFDRGTNEVFEQMKSWGADAEKDTYIAGHDWEMWTLAFTRIAQRIFPTK